MAISRLAVDRLHEALQGNKVVMLLGARQVGKTTLIEPFIRERGGLILNCDIEVDKARLSAAASLAPNDAMALLGNPLVLVIDEAQNLPEVGRIVKGWYDSRVSTKFVLLGSSSLDLLDHSAEPLTGRNEKITLPPLLFREVVGAQSWFSQRLPVEKLHTQFGDQIQTLMLQQMVYGSYPEAVTTADKERYLLNLSADYLLRDILQSGLVKSPESVKRLLMMLAHQAGSEVSVNELSNQLNIARQTVESYLELLERSYVVFRLRAFSTNQRKEISKSQKIFFWDTGIRNALLKEFSMSPLRSDIGMLFENWVVTEVAKANALDGDRNTLHFWRKTEGPEVDLVIKGTDRLEAYEMKWSDRSPTRGSRSFSNAYEIPVRVITKTNVLDLVMK